MCSSDLLKAMIQGRDIEASLALNMKGFLNINGNLFFKGVEGLLMKCVLRQERLARLGVFWPEMANDAKGEQRDCKTCSIIPPDQAKMLNSEVQEEDWQDPYLRYLLEGVLPVDRLKGKKLKKYAIGFKMVDGNLFKRRIQGNWLVCIPNKEVKGILLDLHEGEPTRHPGGKMLWQMALHQGYS